MTNMIAESLNYQLCTNYAENCLVMGENLFVHARNEARIQTRHFDKQEGIKPQSNGISLEPLGKAQRCIKTSATSR
jgi:hypothetical protein